MRVVSIPLNSDNYGYLIINEKSKNCAVVDISSQPDKVLETAKTQGVSITSVLTTHKHWDHAGGNEKFRELVPGVSIFGSRIDNPEGCTHFLSDNDEFEVADGIKVRCILTPGHTMGHLSYFVQHNEQKAVFTGDCLFIGGCGKFFEGTGSDMYEALYSKLLSLPEETEIYCGHEYTLSNYRFALSVDPENADLIAANEEAKRLRDEGKPTIPSTIGKELRTNPFLRVCQPCIASKFPGVTGANNLLTAVREAKNNFK